MGQIRHEKPRSRVYRGSAHQLVSLTAPMSHVCYEGSCASCSGRVFPTIRGLQQHQLKSHKDTPEQETSLGKSRSLKRKRDEEEEEQRRRDVEARLVLEAMVDEPELRPVRPIYCTYKIHAELMT